MFRKILVFSALALIAPSLVGFAVADEGYIPPEFESEAHLFEEIMGGGTHEGDSALGNEQVVEGHTTFITMAMRPPRTFNIEGYVTCEYGVFGIHFGLPPTFERAVLECRIGNRVYATPDGYSAPPSSQAATPTGRYFPVVDPQGRTWLTEEVQYQGTRVGPDGTMESVTAYAWRVEPSRDMLTTVNGNDYNFAMKIPQDRLDELGVKGVVLYPERALAGNK